MANEIRLLLADDHAVVRSGLRMLLQAQPDMVIIGEAETGQEAVQRAVELAPDVVLMDVQMPGMNGIEATRRIKAEAPATAVLALTMYEDDQYFFEMLRAGASGYVPKRAAPDELVSAIRAAGRGEVFLYPSLAGRLVKDY
ncbi:MAG TPA: response regulator transcription factor, partial [Promineifilum sp.]|nr:response regulator transcription factor [Promineifilum sp.]